MGKFYDDTSDFDTDMSDISSCSEYTDIEDTSSGNIDDWETILDENTDSIDGNTSSIMEDDFSEDIDSGTLPELEFEEAEYIEIEESLSDSNGASKYLKEKNHMEDTLFDIEGTEDFYDLTEDSIEDLDNDIPILLDENIYTEYNLDLSSEQKLEDIKITDTEEHPFDPDEDIIDELPDILNEIVESCPEFENIDSSETGDYAEVTDAEVGDIKNINTDSTESYNADTNKSDSEPKKADNNTEYDIPNSEHPFGNASNSDANNASEANSTESSEKKTAELVKDIVDQNVTASVLPKSHGHWEGEKGNSKWIPDANSTVTWQKGGKIHTVTYQDIIDKYNIEDGIEYYNKEPDFSKYEDSFIQHVELDSFSDKRDGSNGTYTKAASAAAQRLSKETGEVWSTQRVQKYMQDHNLTWHECGDRKTVRAIPTEINAAFKHTGGISVKKSLNAMAKVSDEEFGLSKGYTLVRNGPLDNAHINKDELDAAIKARQDSFRKAKQRK
ncbi:HNH endonuclease [Clostridiales bacterium FE2011]|nr:HNH endonuclease [Clostridiales bacterium FE2011]